MNKHATALLRKMILERFGKDISEAKYFFSSVNHAFIFPGETYMIRVSKASKRSRKEIIAEMLWIDDLKQFKQTICEPNVSIHGNLLEEFEIDGELYRAGMFRTARGKVETTYNTDPMYFICVGDLLGSIHKVSTNERELGIKYQRRSAAEQFTYYKQVAFPTLSEELCTRITDIEAKVNSLPSTLGEYGICHGDFHQNNFFVESNNIWLFDFDSCCYANYMYDIASFIHSCFLHGYKEEKDCRKVLYKHILPYLKIGYEIHHTVPPDFWDTLELFISYRVAYALMALIEINNCRTTKVEYIKNSLIYLLSEDDILDAISKFNLQHEQKK